MRLSNLPPGVTDRMIEEQFGGDDEEGEEMTKHTPGPWNVHGRTIYGSNSICQTVEPLGFYRSQEETDANARLIAAAPALLEALEGLLENCALIHKYWGEGDNSKRAAAAEEEARAAIAQARGENQ